MPKKWVCGDWGASGSRWEGRAPSSPVMRAHWASPLALSSLLLCRLMELKGSALALSFLCTIMLQGPPWPQPQDLSVNMTQTESWRSCAHRGLLFPCGPLETVCGQSCCRMRSLWRKLPCFSSPGHSRPSDAQPTASCVKVPATINGATLPRHRLTSKSPCFLCQVPESWGGLLQSMYCGIMIDILYPFSSSRLSELTSNARFSRKRPQAHRKEAIFRLRLSGHAVCSYTLQP